MAIEFMAVTGLLIALVIASTLIHGSHMFVIMIYPVVVLATVVTIAYSSFRRVGHAPAIAIRRGMLVSGFIALGWISVFLLLLEEYGWVAWFGSGY